MPDITIKWESWGEFWPDGQKLLWEEYDEHRESSGLWKPHAPHVEVLNAMSLSGLLHISVARVNGVMGAFCMFTLDVDLESAGYIIARQGAFYATRRFRQYHLGLKVFREGLKKMRELKASEIELHHPVGGRGMRLASLFFRLKARPCNVTYLLRSEPT